MLSNCIFLKKINDIETIKRIFPSKAEASNASSANWITTHVHNETMEKSSKIMLLLKSCFVHWLSATSRDSILKLCESMTGRSTTFGHGHLDMSFYSNGSAFLRNYVETHFCFIPLMFHALNNLMPGVLNNCRLFRDNLNFHIHSEGHTLC